MPNPNDICETCNHPYHEHLTWKCQHKGGCDCKGFVENMNPECPECEKPMKNIGRTTKKGGGEKLYCEHCDTLHIFFDDDRIDPEVTEYYKKG